MANKFRGDVGYAFQEQTAPGVYQDKIVVRKHYGDIRRNHQNVDTQDQANDRLTISVLISIMTDAFANEHFSAIRFVKWSGVYWRVTDIDINSPRLNLTLGGIYNGPKS